MLGVVGGNAALIIVLWLHCGLFGFDFNSDNVQASLKEGIQWEDEIHIAKMLGFNTFTYTPGNTDLFIDYSSFNRDLYYAPSELTYDMYGYVNYQNYYGTNGIKNRLNEADGDSFNLDSMIEPKLSKLLSSLLSRAVTSSSSENTPPTVFSCGI